MGYVEDLRGVVGNRPLLLVATAVLIFDADNRLLLQHRQSGVWGFPGGNMEIGETVEDCARREAQEETGLCIGKLSFLGMVTDPALWTLPNGHTGQSVVAVFATRDIQGGTLQADGVEGTEVAWLAADQWPQGVADRIRRLYPLFVQRTETATEMLQSLTWLAD